MSLKINMRAFSSSVPFDTEYKVQKSAAAAFSSLLQGYRLPQSFSNGQIWLSYFLFSLLWKGKMDILVKDYSIDK